MACCSLCFFTLVASREGSTSRAITETANTIWGFRIYSGYYHCNSRWASHHRGIQPLGKYAPSWFLRWVFHLFACLVILIINETTIGILTVSDLPSSGQNFLLPWQEVLSATLRLLPDMECPRIITEQDLDRSYYCS